MSTGILTVFGQSNAAGFRSNPALLPSSGEDSEIPYAQNQQSLTPIGSYFDLQPILKEDGGGNGFTDPAITIPAGFSSWGYGCEITCARALHSEGRPIAVAKRTQGDTSIYDYWNPQPLGFGYEATINYKNGLIEALNNEGTETYHLGAIFWQGENDAATEVEALQYEYNLRRMITFFRVEAGDMNLPFVICLTTTGGNAAYRPYVQEAQKRIANSMKNVAIYNPTGLPIYSDGIHFWQDAHVTSGNAIADIFKDYLGL